MLPSSNWMIADPRMYCAPTVWCVQPTEYTQHGRPLPAAVLRDGLAQRQELLRRHAGHLLDHLGRVAGVVPLEHLEHAARVLQRFVTLGPADAHVGAVATHLVAGGPFGQRSFVGRFRALAAVGAVAVATIGDVRVGPAVRTTLPGVTAGMAAARVLQLLFLAGAGGTHPVVACVAPGLRVVGAGLRVVAGEDAVQVVDVHEVVPQDHGGVGEGLDVLLEVLAGGQDVVDHAAEESDVATGPQRDVHVRDGRGPGEPRVDVDDLGAARLRFHHPLETDRVTFGHVGALDDDAVGVLQVLQEARGAATAERGPQTGDGGAVSNTGLVLDLYGAHGREDLLDQIVLFVVQGGAAERGDRPSSG